MSSDALKPFREVRSAFTQVEIPHGKSGLSFVLHTVEIADGTRDRVTALIRGKEGKPLGRFANLLLSEQLGPRTQHILFHILFAQESFRADLKSLSIEIMTIFEDEEITAKIERNPMRYFNLFTDDGRLDPPLTTALEALRQCAHDE